MRFAFGAAPAAVIFISERAAGAVLVLVFVDVGVVDVGVEVEVSGLAITAIDASVAFLKSHTTAG